MSTSLFGGCSYTSYTSYRYRNNRESPTPQATTRSGSSLFKPLPKHGSSSSVPALSARRGSSPQSPSTSVSSTSDAGVQDSIATVIAAPHPRSLEQGRLDKLNVLLRGIDKHRSAIIRSGIMIHSIFYIENSPY
jgi:hypothetical protein